MAWPDKTVAGLTKKHWCPKLRKRKMFLQMQKQLRFCSLPHSTVLLFAVCTPLPYSPQLSAAPVRPRMFPHRRPKTLFLQAAWPPHRPRPRHGRGLHGSGKAHQSVLRPGNEDTAAAPCGKYLHPPAGRPYRLKYSFPLVFGSERHRLAPHR